MIYVAVVQTLCRFLILKFTAAFCLFSISWVTTSAVEDEATLVSGFSPITLDESDNKGLSSTLRTFTLLLLSFQYVDYIVYHIFSFPN